MIALVRWLIGYFKKEYRFLSRYEKSHPHFFWFIGLDALLSTLLVLVSFQVVAAQGTTDPVETLLQHFGVVGTSVDKFVDRIKNDNDSIYWLGPIPGTTYEISHSLEYLDVVTYIPQGSNLNDMTQRRLTIETFENREAYAAHVHVLVDVDMTKHVTEKGVTVEYDAQAMNAMTISILGKKQFVVVNYPTNQTEQDFLKDAEKLELVK